MSITIGDYNLKGPYSSTGSLEDRAGVYVIFCDSDNKYTVLDVGESEKVKTRVENHDRKDCWAKNCDGELMVAVYYVSKGRDDIEKDIRDTYNPPCGEY